MSNEFGFPFPTGHTLYGMAKNATGQFVVVSTGIPEAWNVAHRVTYLITLTELAGSSGEYEGSVPANTPAGLYDFRAYLQVGGSPAVSDPCVDRYWEWWTGTALLALAGDAFARIGVNGVGLTSIPYTGPAALTDYQQRGQAVTLPATAPASFLDAITATEPVGPSSGWNFRQWLRWGVMRQVNAVRTPTVLTVKTLAGTTSTTQAVADDGNGNESTGPTS